MLFSRNTNTADKERLITTSILHRAKLALNTNAATSQTARHRGVWLHTSRKTRELHSSKMPRRLWGPPSRLWGPPSLSLNGLHRLLPQGQSGRRVKLTTHFHQVPISRVTVDTPPQPTGLHVVHVGNCSRPSRCTRG